MYQNIPTKVLTGEVRLSYANLTAPYARPGKEPRYSVTLLVPKTDALTFQEMKAAEEAAATEATGKLWNGIRPPVMQSVIWDGDGVRQNGTPFGAECKGHWVVTASSVSKPQVVDLSGNDLLPQDIYSGMRARATINFFGYFTEGKKGVGCGLGNVQKLRDDEPLAGGASAAADFGIAPVPQTYGTAPGAVNPLTGQPM